ncbi:ParM/StbA family protein [Paenibacillus illinoisensis]|uniref:ParM/StbA family protein n=1 Tax=Paenibacillus illinoisensis TaxID=59845 RepID=UPI00301C6140
MPIKQNESNADFGNSTNKMIINDTLHSQPAVIKRLYTKPDDSDKSIAAIVNNLMNELVVNISSKAIKRDGIYAVGHHANLTTTSDNMNIRLGNKHKHDIPVVMTLAMQAAHEVQCYYSTHNTLPDTIEVNGSLAGSIPASEWNPTKAKILEDRFTEHTHVVTVHIGKTSVVVTIKYTKSKITQEGLTGLYGFVFWKSPKKEATEKIEPPHILSKFRETYADKPELLKLTPRDFATKKGLLVDIGSGTVELIHTHGLNPVLDNCNGKKHGVGHAAEAAAKLLTEETQGYLEVNRQRFDQILQDPTDNLYSMATSFMEEAQYSEANNILVAIQDHYSTIGGDIEFIMVFGGGSITFEPDLYQEAKTFADAVHCLLVWIPGEYAVNLNVYGLDILHKKVLFQEAGVEG